MKSVIWLLVVVVVVVLIFVFTNREESPQPEEVTIPAVGEEPLAEPIIQRADLEEIDPFKGDGVATRQFGETRFSHTVVANIGDPAPGTFYEGWLVDKTPSLRFFSTGKLERQGSQYTLSYSADSGERDFSEYNDVVITQETEANGLDGIPEDHVLEGSFSN